MGKLEAELYALTHRGNDGDLEFYANACAGARSVLELGTGAGRLLPTLARAAREVVGLDQSEDLLTSARQSLRLLPEAQQKRVRVIQADMRSFDLGRRFDRILLPYNALYCLLSRRDIKQCFGVARNHLAEGGQFLFDVWTADEFHASADAPEYHDDVEPILTIQHARQTWDVFEKSRLVRSRQRLDVVYTYVSRERGQRVPIRIEQRYARVDEIGQLLSSAGLRVVARFGEFDLRRFTRRSPRLIVCAVADA